MKRTHLLIAAVTVFMVIAVGLLLISQTTALSTVETVGCLSSTSNADECLHFPGISGANLPGQTFDMPDDFAGAAKLVIVPFDEGQQVRAQTWLPLAQALSTDFPTFSYYSVAIFPDIAAPIRAIIRAGMNLTITDAAIRDITITAFLDDETAFLSALHIENKDTMQVYLLNAGNDIVWRGSGDFTEEQGNALRDIVQRALAR